MKGAKTPTELESQVLKLDDYIRLYEQISTVALPDDIKAAILISVCPEEVRQHFDLTDDLEKPHRELRERGLASMFGDKATLRMYVPNLCVGTQRP